MLDCHRSTYINGMNTALVLKMVAVVLPINTGVMICGKILARTNMIKYMAYVDPPSPNRWLEDIKSRSIDLLGISTDNGWRGHARVRSFPMLLRQANLPLTQNRSSYVVIVCKYARSV